ncbi:MAG: uroporphyrinogen-III C-methyltransferase [Pseudomonadota bacterium]|nr:uroporphyrinogen-III C-methyltransferase [Pseudomonadota bacterium]
MNDNPTAAVTAEPALPSPVADRSPPAPPSNRTTSSYGDARWWFAIAAVLAVLAGVSLVIAWKTQQRVKSIEQELVRRLEDSQLQSGEARVLAKQSQDSVLAASAKVALLEARVAEVAVQRSQLEDLMQSLSRSRDENLLVDVDTGIRVAMQQTAITGSAEPLVAMLKQADDRLNRYNQPRLEGVRRAIARDLDRVKAVGVTDIPTLSIKLDEAVRLIDELPLLSNAEPHSGALKGKPGAAAIPAPSPAAASSASRAASAPQPAWWQTWDGSWTAVSERVWGEAKSLIRVTRIDHPEAMLLAPDHAFFVRENVKLRLLNARLALMSRQFDTAQSDLQVVQQALDRYFDRSSRRTTLASELVRQVATQARQVTVPKPDDTLVALAAAAAGR